MSSLKANCLEGVEREAMKPMKRRASLTFASCSLAAVTALQLPAEAQAPRPGPGGRYWCIGPATPAPPDDLSRIPLASLSDGASSGLMSIYGRDSRIEYHEAVRRFPQLEPALDASLAIMPRTYSRKANGGVALQVGTTVTTLADARNSNDRPGLLCKGERFCDQPAAPGCSGTLVGTASKPLALTAAHCFEKSQEFATAQENVLDLAQSDFVLGYRYDTAVQGVDTFSSFRACTVRAGTSPHRHAVSKVDWMLIELDCGGIKLPTPMALADPDDVVMVPGTTELAVIGHPEGIPVKLATDGRVRKLNLNPPIIMAELDVFRGGSGGGVYHSASAASPKLIGVLSGGAPDYKYKEEGQCYFANVYSLSEPDKKTEKVTRVSSELFKTYRRLVGD